MEVKVLETPRLMLRPCRMEDLEVFHRYCANPQVGPNAGWKPHETLEESRKILEDWVKGSEQEGIWAIEEKNLGQMVGSIGLHMDGLRPGVPNCRMMGYALAQEQWGKGLMTEAAQALLRYAFDTLGLALVTINHYAYNARSRRVIEKCGFTYEGTLRQGVGLYDGRVEDLCCYSMTAVEYWAGQKEE